MSARCAPFALLALLAAAAPAAAGQAPRATATAALERGSPAQAEIAPAAAESPASGEADAPSAAASPPTGNPLWAIPLSALGATRERPLFAPTRRPPPQPRVDAPAPAAAPPAPTAEAPAAPERPSLTLIGTVVGAERKVAVLFDQSSHAVIRLREGGENAGWRVQSVTARSAVLEKDGRSVTLDLPKTGEPVDPSLAPTDPDLPPG